MKLFSTEEIKSSKATELARDIRRTSEIKEALDKARTELNDANAEFDSVLANQRVKWAKEQESAMVVIKDLQMEIDQLQRVRQQLLIPIDLEKKRADNIVIEANVLMTAAIDKQKYADEMAEKLQDHLDEVGEKDEALEQREKRLFVKEEGLKEQAKITKQNSEQVTLQMQTFISEMEAKENNFNTRKRQLDLLEVNIIARDKINSERERYLNERERQINDKYETLLRTQKRLKQ